MSHRQAVGYACSICGYHPDSRSTWCGAGCGRDYNQMTRIVLDEFWSEILANETVPPQAMLELNDYAALLRNVPTVYDHVTGGRISKPHTIASAVIAEHDELVQRLCDEAVTEAVAGRVWDEHAVNGRGEHAPEWREVGNQK